MHRRLLPRLGDFLFVCLFAGCLLVGQRMLNIDSDLGRHLVLGTYMIESRSIPVRDVLSFTMRGEPRPPYEWLAQVLFAVAHRLLGLDGVVLLTSFVIGCAFLLLYVDARERSGAPLVALVLTVWAAAASSLHWLTRPHVFSFLCLVLWLRLLDRLRLGQKETVWQLPLLMLVWANLHGGFIVGFLAWAAYVAGWALERWRRSAPPEVGFRLLLVGVTSLAASVVTPDLWSNWAAVLRNSSAYVLARTTETMPVDFAAVSSWPFLGLLALGLLLAFPNRRSITPAHGFLLLGLGVLGVAMARNIPFLSIGAVPILGIWSRQLLGGQSRLAQLERTTSRIESGLRALIWPPLAVSLAAIFLAVHSLTGQQSVYTFEPAIFPVLAANWMETHPIEGEMFNEIDWGGYLLYRMWPERRVFIDSQSDFYGEQYARDYAAVVGAADGWEEQLSRHGISWVVISPGAPLAERLRLDTGWQAAYQDSTAVIFVRKHV